MLGGSLSSRLLAVLGLGCTVGAELAEFPSRENFSRWIGARATVLGDYVYVDGGEISQFVDGVLPKEQWRAGNPVNVTLSIDMSKSWKTNDAVLRTIPKSAMHKSNVVLWTDQAAGVFYSWAGKFPSGVDMIANALWKFTADGSGGGEWSVQEPANPALFDSLHTAEFAAYANTNTTGFAIGGIASGWTEYRRARTQTIPGMVAFNMQTKEWQNGTTSFSPFDTLVGAAAHYVPSFGPNGLVVVMGGHKASLVGEPKISEEPPYDLRNLTMFDPVTKNRYWQTTTGSIPPTPRIHMCTAGFQSPDGSYEIFVFGGRNLRDKFNYKDAYVLSLPGFVWTKAPDAPAGRRTSHTCVPVGRRQVLSIGGTNMLWSDPDPAPYGLLAFDVTAMKWKDEYDADAEEYESAEEIKGWYSRGSMDEVDWSSDDVRQLFVTAASSSPTDSPSPTPTPSSSSPPSSSSSPPSSSSSSTPVGAIAGGVVGGVAGLALLAFAAWFFCIRRRRRGNAAFPDGAGAGPGGGGDGYYTSMPIAVHDQDHHGGGGGGLSSSPPPPPQPPQPPQQPQQPYYYQHYRYSGSMLPEKAVELGPEMPQELQEGGNGYAELYGNPLGQPAEMDATPFSATTATAVESAVEGPGYRGRLI